MKVVQYLLRTFLVSLVCFSPASLAGDTELRQTLATVEQRLKQDPANPRLWAARGAILAELGQDAASLQSFEKSLAISPKFLPALEGAAEVGYRMHSPSASDFIARILRQDPANQTANAMAGALDFESHKCRESIEHFSKSGPLAKESPDALWQWGECLLVLDNPAEAAEKFQASLHLKPGRRAAFDLAVALHMAGKEQEALEAAKLLPEDAAVLNLRASIHVARNEFPLALAAFRQAIALAPKVERNYIDLASLCLDHQSFDVASDVVKAGLVALPESAALYTLKGAIAAQFSHMEEAAADFEHASRLQPDQFYSDAGLTLLLEQQDQVEKAIAIVRPRLVRDPRNAVLHFLLGDLLLKLQDAGAPQKAEAKRRLQEAIRLNPAFAKAHAVLGKLELQQGDAESAVKELKIALEFDAGDRIAMNQLVIAYRKLGRSEDARAAAMRLQQVLAEGRREEVQKNSVRFVRLNSGQQ